MKDNFYGSAYLGIRGKRSAQVIQAQIATRGEQARQRLRSKWIRQEALVRKMADEIQREVHGVFPKGLGNKIREYQNTRPRARRT